MSGKNNAALSLGPPLLVSYVTSLPTRRLRSCGPERGSLTEPADIEILAHNEYKSATIFPMSNIFATHVTQRQHDDWQNTMDSQM